MKRILITVAALLIMGDVSTSQADKNLAMQSGCLGCHKVDGKLVGPSFQDIAGKYADSDVDRLAAKVSAGSPAGEPLVWGGVPMPANPSPPDNIKTVIRWMLAEGEK
jgi:cytochrome c